MVDSQTGSRDTHGGWTSLYRLAEPCPAVSGRPPARRRVTPALHGVTCVLVGSAAEWVWDKGHTALLRLPVSRPRGLKLKRAAGHGPECVTCNSRDTVSPGHL